MSGSEVDEIPMLVEEGYECSDEEIEQLKGGGLEPVKKMKRVQEKHSEIKELVPLTILTGFLGSGKTTFVSNCLKQLTEQGIKVAVIQNEVSASGVEDAVVVDEDGSVFEDFLELANGCVCCTVKTDFVSALEELLKLKDFGYIILECSGAADPRSLIELFWIDKELEIGVKLDGIVCLVDSMNFSALSSADKTLLHNQVVYADRILMNKSDQVSSEVVRSVQESIQSMNSLAVLHQTTYSQIDLENVLNINAYELYSSDDQLKRISSSAHFCGDHESNSMANLVFEQTDIESQGIHWGISMEKLQSFLVDILWEEHEWEILRVKGVFASKGNNEKYFLQAVYQLFELDQGEAHKEWKDDETRCCRLVIIGRNLNSNVLKDGFINCFQ